MNKIKTAILAHVIMTAIKDYMVKNKAPQRLRTDRKAIMAATAKVLRGSTVESVCNLAIAKAKKAK